MGKLFLTVAVLGSIAVSSVPENARAQVLCVSEICGGAGGIFSGSPFAGFNVGPSFSRFVVSDVLGSLPADVRVNLFPAQYVNPTFGAGIDVNQALSTSLYGLAATFGQRTGYLNGLAASLLNCQYNPGLPPFLNPGGGLLGC